MDFFVDFVTLYVMANATSQVANAAGYIANRICNVTNSIGEPTGLQLWIASFATIADGIGLAATADALSPRGQG